VIGMFNRIGQPFLRALDPETAHRFAVNALKVLPLGRPAADDPGLAVPAFGLNFPNPIGLAAGFDKNGEVFDAVLRLGFGFTEIGTVTPLPQPGNARPRIFRLDADEGVINRLGFNSDGRDAVLTRLKEPAAGIVGINIGANKDSQDRIADYAQCFVRLAPLADYVAVNVSSPNTPGLRGLQDRDALTRLLDRLRTVRGAMTKPILLKIAPDLDLHALDDIAAVVARSGTDGVIVSNTTISRPPLKSGHAKEPGGLSGKPLLALSTQMLREMRKRVAPEIVLVGVGGISSGRDAYEKIRAGATLVQLYTSLVYHGPSLVQRIKHELVAALAKDGFKTVAQAVGADAN
jgi:dihydroorotate dehydrogenase